MNGRDQTNGEKDPIKISVELPVIRVINTYIFKVFIITKLRVKFEVVMHKLDNDYIKRMIMNLSIVDILITVVN